MFKIISHIDDIAPVVSNKKEIRFMTQPNQTVVGCYIFADSNTFDSAEALECRGIAFDRNGHVVSRPLHKFFNVGEKPHLSVKHVLERTDVAGIYDKLDGSMISTAWIDNALAWKSKKSFESDVVVLAKSFLSREENSNIVDFATSVASRGMTAIFEFTHPDARIVVEYKQPSLKLLHVRDNRTGAYVLLDSSHSVHEMIETYGIDKVHRYEDMSVSDALNSLETMDGKEGYIVQFSDGDMVKLKCLWYLRLHRCITFLRERDIARLALNEELDDVKAALTESGIDLCEVNTVEAKLKGILTSILDEVESVYQKHKDLDRKHIALATNKHPYFGFIMQRYTGGEINLLEWYAQHKLKADFSLRVLTNGARAEAIED